MLSLLLVVAGVAAFEIAAVRYGTDSRVDIRDGARGTPLGSRSRRWL